MKVLLRDVGQHLIANPHACDLTVKTDTSMSQVKGDGMNELIVLFRPYPVGALLKKLSEDRDSFNLSEMRAPCRFMNGGRRRRSGLLVQVRAFTI